jgi:large subunit ribosomal protein L5
MKENPMREIRLEKITLNMGVGQSGPKLENAKTLLERITGRKALITVTKKRTTFGMARRKPIGVKVTIRGQAAYEWLQKLLRVIDNKLKIAQFDSSGNFSFGIAEYISVPGIKYDPEIGIMGFDVAVTLARPGYRIKVRRIKQRSVGKKHRITKEQAIEWVKKKFGVEII